MTDSLREEVAAHLYDDLSGKGDAVSWASAPAIWRDLCHRRADRILASAWLREARRAAWDEGFTGGWEADENCGFGPGCCGNASNPYNPKDEQ